MTCDECQPLVIDLARGLSASGVGEAVQRGDVLSHIARCTRCAEWLAKQEALTEALRAGAEADASLAAPPSVEANVMAAFRARQAQREAQGQMQRQSLGMGVVSLATDSSAQGVRRWKPTPFGWTGSGGRRSAVGLTRAGLAAAAVVLIVALSMVSLRWLMTPAPAGSRPDDATDVPSAAVSGAGAAGAGAAGGGAAGAGAAGPPRGSTTSASTASTTATTSPSDSSAGRGSSRATVTGTDAAIVEVLPEKRSKGRPAPPRAVAQRVGVTPGLDARRSVDARRGIDARRGGANELGGPAFVLLPYVEPLRPTEMRHIMRVRMPRTFVVAGDVQSGNTDGATVLADVLVGEDGTARAVRIVQ